MDFKIKKDLFVVVNENCFYLVKKYKENCIIEKISRKASYLLLDLGQKIKLYKYLNHN